jgi:DNA-binding response OmpR family regulator
MRVVSISVTLTGPEETLTRLATTLGATNIDWDVETVTLPPPQPQPDEKRPIRIDIRSRVLSIDGAETPTTKREFNLLQFLAENAGQAFTRQEIMQEVWGHEKTGQRTVDVYVRRLRAKLGRHESHLATVHGYGYRLATGIASVVE